MSRKRRNGEPQASTSSKRPHLDNNKNLTISSETNCVSQHDSNPEYWQSGKIIKIHLLNFMCHANFEINFCNRINFLVGSNGSGKSAILTALVVGLGANARSTNRSTSIKNLVKNGENSGTIGITIANIAPDAYDVETYGNKITVERKIMATGQSSYKIMDERGRVISKSTEDLKKILLYHNIQTDNPVFVLNQDAARTFLKEMDQFKNYQLFQKATQIEIVLEKLTKSNQLSNEYKLTQNCTKKKIKLLEDEIDTLDKKFQRLTSVQTIKKNIEEKKIELNWLKVTNQEKVVQNIRTKVEGIENEIKKMDNKLENRDDVKKEIEVQIKDLEMESQTINSSLQKEIEKRQQLVAQLKEENKRKELDKNNRHKLKEKIKTYETQRDTLTDVITKTTAEGSSREQRLREEQAQQVEKLNKEKDEVTSMKNSVKQELNILKNTTQEQRQQIEALERKKTEFEHSIKSREVECNKISQSPKSNIAVYGEHLPALLKAINQAHAAGHFKEKPKGPIGHYVEVSDKKWRGTVEQLTMGCLNCFLVDSARDRSVLDNIMKRQFPEAKHAIITMKFMHKQYDVSNGCVNKVQGADRLIDIIKCSDPDIVNCLIDRLKIETILLVEDQALATHLTVDIANVPKNLKKVILLTPHLEYNPAPKYRTYSLQQHSPRFIQVDMKERQKLLKEEIKKYEIKKREVDTNLRQLKDSLEVNKKHCMKKQELLSQHEDALNTIGSKLEDAINVEIPSECEIEVLQKELDKIIKIIESIQRKIDESEGSCMQSQQLFLEKNKEVERAQQNIQEMQDQLNQVVAKKEAKKMELNTLNISAKQWHKHREKFNNDLEKYKREYDTENQKLNAAKANAKRNNAEYVESENTEDNLTKAIQSLEIQLNQIRSSDENIDDIEALLNDRRSKLDAETTYYETISGILNALKKSRIQRFQGIKRLQEHMALRVDYIFKHILEIRQYVGEAKFDHIKKTLKISMIPRDNHIGNAVSSTKSLSGGERSYSTIALLLSLWSCVDHPFYFLDEYDVFTDQLNRELMTKLLIDEGTKKEHRQYNFLTPQDLSFVEASNIIKIQRLPCPER